jgi:STE24 endopeptidase
VQDILLYSFVILSLVVIIVKIILNTVNSKYIGQHASEVPKAFSDKIDLESHQKAAAYSQTKAKFSLFGLIKSFGTLYFSLFWLFPKLDLWIRSQYELTDIMRGLLFIAILSVLSFVWSLPETLYYTFVIEENFGFNKTTLKTFFADILKSSLLGILLGTPILYAILKFMEVAGNLWWFYAASVFIAFQLILVWAYPKFIAPLFNKFYPLEDNDLTEKLNLLIQKIELKFKDFYVMNASLRSSHGNAYFTGFGKNKRIVFFDTLLETLDHNEVIAVLAHELGHLKHKHILKAIIKSFFFIFLGFWILGELAQKPWFYATFNIKDSSNYMALTLFMTISPVYTFLMTPISSWLSRKNEYEADKFACDHADGKDLISALLKMYKDNSSSLTPHPVFSKFYYSHPPAKERIEFIESCVN